MNPLVSVLKDAAQDFEFYPTTQEIIDRLVADLAYLREEKFTHYANVESVLDIGAGSGKVLCALRDQAQLRSLYAIEKSSVLCEQMDADIFIVGTEFQEQSLVSKQVDLTFCNLHLRIHQKLALALNVEVGRLRGWIKSGQEAADELGDASAATFFGTHLRLGPGSLPMLAAA
jgi:hypothetical protein